MTVDESKMRVISAAVNLEDIVWINDIGNKYGVSFSQALRWAVSYAHRINPPLGEMINPTTTLSRETSDVDQSGM